MKEFIIKKITNKEWVQDQIIEIIGDTYMIALAVVAGYIIKIKILGI